jgi:uncharacterized protein (DUF433 family)
MSSYVGGVDSTQPYPVQDGTSFRDRMQTVMQPVSDLLGVSTDDLANDVKDGKSLSDVANEKGVSRDDLLAAIKQGLQQADGDTSTDSLLDPTSTSSTSSTDSTQLTSIANRIADHKRGGHGHHGHHSAPPADNSNQSDALNLLQQAGFDPQELLQQLQSGSISSTIADQFGISAQSYSSLLNGQSVDVSA